MAHTSGVESVKYSEFKAVVPEQKINGPDNSNTAHLELGITLALFLWPSLTLAVSSAWGGPDSVSKREWFASETIDLVAANPDADVEWIEEFLLNVMLDEFEVNVDDESAHEVAQTIVRLCKDCANGNWAEVLSMKARWDSREAGKNNQLARYVRAEDDESEVSGSDDEEEILDCTMDVDSERPPQLLERKEHAEPEVDEDGFTKVTRKR